MNSIIYLYFPLLQMNLTFGKMCLAIPLLQEETQSLYLPRLHHHKKVHFPQYPAQRPVAVTVAVAVPVTVPVPVTEQVDTLLNEKMVR